MHLLEHHWQRITPITIALLPLTILFASLSWLRRSAYRLGLLRTVRCNVPVIVAGNLNAGGTGKTPLVIWLAQALQHRGFTPGVISRGYGGRADQIAVNASTSARDAGDEPVLIARRVRCPVWIGRDRAVAAAKLLDANPEINVIISDDGLQHYRLARDCELAVVDSQQQFGNGFLLPSGPLREPVSRLRTVDGVVFNGGTPAGKPNHGYEMQLHGDRFYGLAHPERLRRASDFGGISLHAVAGIGNPQRFFDHLRSLGLKFTPHAFPDHHVFSAADLDFDSACHVLMTEKDAIKCVTFAHENWWVMPVSARIDTALADLVIRRIGSARGH